MTVFAVCRYDQLAGNLARYTVTFDADLSALRNAIHQFGRVTTSQSLATDDYGVKNWPSMLRRCSHNTDDQVSILLQSLSTCVAGVSEFNGFCKRN